MNQLKRRVSEDAAIVRAGGNCWQVDDFTQGWRFQTSQRQKRRDMHWIWWKLERASTPARAIRGSKPSRRKLPAVGDSSPVYSTQSLQYATTAVG